MNKIGMCLWRSRTTLYLLMALCLTSISSGVAFAQPVPSVLHDYVVRLTPQLLTVTSYLRISPELVPSVYKQIETDNDGKTSSSELQNWFEAHPAKLRITLDSVEVPLTLSKLTSLTREDLLLSVNKPITVIYSFAPRKALSGKHRIRITYGDNYLSYDGYYISVAGDLDNDGRPVGVSRSLYPATYQVIYQMPGADVTQTQAQNLPKGGLSPAPWSSGQRQISPQTQDPSKQGASGQGAAQPAQQLYLPASPPPASPPANGTAPGISAQLLGTLRNLYREIWIALSMLGLALAAGALHALTPGHGRAMPGTYLDGSKGGVRDAILLGSVVTFTLTTEAAVLGLVLLLVSNFAMPGGFTPALELASGAVVIALGLYLLLRRLRELKKASAGDYENEQPHLHSHTHVPSHRLSEMAQATANLSGAGAGAGAGASTMALLPVTSSLPVRLVNRGRFVSYDPGKSSLPGYSYGTDNHEHANGTDNELYSHVGQAEGWRTLIRAGISEGIVPRPEVLAILVMAMGVGQFALGLSLIGSFSLGLIGVLLAQGVALVKGKGAVEKTSRAHLSTSRVSPVRWVAPLSATIVIVAGMLMIMSALSSV